MLRGRTPEGHLALATRGAEATCPGCGEILRPKCGLARKQRWHWAHINKDCDPWHEPEGEWHLSWKMRAEEGCTEVVMGPHRADIRTHDGLVVELQASAINAIEIGARETFYGNMIWLLDGREWRRDRRFKFAVGRFRHCTSCTKILPDGSLHRRGPCEHCIAGRVVDPLLGDRYQWDHRKVSFDGALMPIYIDTGENIVMIEGALARLGDGRIISYQDFCARFGLNWDPLVDGVDVVAQRGDHVPDRHLVATVLERAERMKPPCAEVTLPTAVEVAFSSRSQETSKDLPKSIALVIAQLQNDIRGTRCDGHNAHARVELGVGADSIGWGIHHPCCSGLSERLVARLQLAKKEIRRVARSLGGSGRR